MASFHPFMAQIFAISDLALGVAAFCSSALAGIVGLGGGMLLLAICPIFLPLNAIIPVHGCSQLASNASRAVFAYRHIQWQFIPAFLAGSALGTSLVYLFLKRAQLTYLPLIIALYMLASLWWPKFRVFVAGLSSLGLIGAVQSGAGLIVGATGPLSTTFLLERLATNPKSAEQIVSTNAILMAFSHALKIAIFAALGFSYLAYWQTIAFLLVGATLGSYFGTCMRRRISAHLLLPLMKVLITLLALHMIWQWFL